MLLLLDSPAWLMLRAPRRRPAPEGRVGRPIISAARTTKILPFHMIGQQLPLLRPRVVERYTR